MYSGVPQNVQACACGKCDKNGPESAQLDVLRDSELDQSWADPFFSSHDNLVW